MQHKGKVNMICVQHRALDDRIHFKQGMALVDAGFQLSCVVACDEGILLDMSGRPLNEAGETVEVDGIELIPVPTQVGKLDGLLKKFYRGPFYDRMVKAAVSAGANIHIAHEPQSIPVAKAAAEITKGQFVFDAHESLHFDNLKDKWAKRKWMSNLPAFIAANELTRSKLEKMNPASQSTTIYNASLFDIPPKSDDDEIILVHEGSFPFNRGLRLLMEALCIIRETIPDFKLRIIGEFKGQEKDFFEKRKKEGRLQKNIELCGWQPYPEVGGLLKGCSIGLILNTFTPNNLYGGPANKLFNYINAGLCVVAVDLPETSKIISEYSCGITLQERSPAHLATAIISLYQDKKSLANFKSNARKAAPSLHWNQEKLKFVAFIEALLNQ